MQEGRAVASYCSDYSCLWLLQLFLQRFGCCFVWGLWKEMDYYNHLELQKHKAGRLWQQVASKAKYKLAVGKINSAWGNLQRKVVIKNCAAQSVRFNGFFQILLQNQNLLGFKTHYNVEVRTHHTSCVSTCDTTLCHFKYLYSLSQTGIHTVRVSNILEAFPLKRKN